MGSTEITRQTEVVYSRIASGSSLTLIVLATLALFVGVPRAAAENDWVSARGDIACKWMDIHPNLYGALSTMRTMEDEGVSRPEVPGVLAEVISTYCPRRANLYQQVKDYLTHMGNPGIIGAG